MVYYFHTIYARADLKYLVKEHSDYELYDGRSLDESDVLIIAVYLNLTALAEFINLAIILQTDVQKYGSLYRERFLFIDMNIDNDNGAPAYIKKQGTILRDIVGNKKYIYYPDVLFLLKRKNSKLLLYNSWETRDLYKCIPVIRHYCNHHKISHQKLLLSMTDHNHMWKRYPPPRIISYDWQFIHAKMTFNREKIVDPHASKLKHLICFNSRSNDERLAATTYLYTTYREKCNLSFLNNKRSAPIAGDMLSLVKCFVSHDNVASFRATLPLSLERGLHESIEESYIMLMFETNIVRYRCQQISEKTYRPIIAGIPFLLWGSQGGILSHLRKMGFKTFSPHIDEEYDNPKYSYMERYRRLIKEVDRLCSLDAQKIDSLYRLCLPMVEHNFTVLESRENIPSLL